MNSVTTCFTLVLLAWSAVAWGQSDVVGTDPENVRLGAASESVWEFGLEVTAQASATGIYATVPFPMPWPEQAVEVLDTIESDQISQLKISKNTSGTRLLEFRIQRMNPGQVEQAFLRLKIRKHMLVAPQDTARYQIANKIPGDVRAYLKPSPYIESSHRKIRDLAKSLFDPSLDGWAQVEKNYRWVREHVAYEFDREIRSCLEALDKGKGACEELSSLFIAICRAQRIPARAVWIPDHTYPEFYLVDKKGNGHWFPCQAAGTYEFGAMTEVRPILQKGDRFRVHGKREELRYVQPTLVARDAQGPLSIKFIRRQVQCDKLLAEPPSG